MVRIFVCDSQTVLAAPGLLVGDKHHMGVTTPVDLLRTPEPQESMESVYDILGRVYALRVSYPR